MSGESNSSIQSLLDRPAEQRLREYKYRCAQALIFGLPVVGLQYFGHLLGGGQVESDRWIAILQSLLAGWVTYVAAMGMLMEGILLLNKRVTMDFFIALLAVILYLYSVISAIGVFFRGRPFYEPTVFHWGVILLAIWAGWRWWRMSS